MAVRENRVIVRGADLSPGFGSNYYVQALEVGAQVASASSGSTIEVCPGHGFAGGDKWMRADGSGYSGIQAITSVDATHLYLPVPYSVATDEILVNPGPDTGVMTPNFDGNGLTIYTNADFTSAAINATVQTDSNGRYRYWHRNIHRWELVRTGLLNGIIALYLDTGGLQGADSSTDNAIVRWDGTSGEALQNSVVTVSDTGALAGITSLSAQNVNTVRYAHLFATSGTGTAASPWVTSGSNPVQSALDDLPVTGGTVYMIPGHYTLGSASAAVTIPTLGVDTLDTRGYRFEGAGRDLVFLEYSGTGTAIRYEGTVLQSNQIVFKGFSLLQTGTARTGNGFWCSYISESLFEDLNVGCLRMNRQTGEPDNGWAVGVKVVATSGSHVADFNRFHRLYCMGNTLGLYLDNQGDNTVVSECSFEPRQDAAVAQDGCHIHNSSGVTVSSSHFNFFNNNGNSFGLQVSGSAKGTVISGNYFENCKSMCHILVDQDLTGTEIIGNSFSFTGASSSVGIRAGLGGLTYKCKGLHIAGNSFFQLSSGNTGIRIGEEVRGFVIAGNGYNNTGGTNRTIQTGAGVDTAGVAVAGARGIVMESLNETNYQPVIQLIDANAVTQGELLLQNNTTANWPSPRIHIVPGTGGGGAGAGVYVACSAAGVFQVQDTSGTFKFSIDQSGNLVALGTLALTGAATLTGGIVGGVPYNAGTWANTTATSGTDTACTSGTAYVGTVRLPQNATITGIQYLVGSVGGTDKVVASLHDSAGALLANSNTAGATVGTLATVQQVPFTGTYAAKGPATYFLALTFNGTTAKFRTVPAHCQGGNGVIGNGVTQTFGTPAAFTAPTSFTADKVPVASLY